MSGGAGPAGRPDLDHIDSVVARSDELCSDARRQLRRSRAMVKAILTRRAENPAQLRVLD
ncbi:MAG TPA: hypothetical protein VF137_06885 [Candidatus Dormibacteraeota bacterium]